MKFSSYGVFTLPGIDTKPRQRYLYCLCAVCINLHNSKQPNFICLCLGRGVNTLLNSSYNYLKQFLSVSFQFVMNFILTNSIPEVIFDPLLFEWFYWFVFLLILQSF